MWRAAAHVGIIVMCSTANYDLIRYETAAYFTGVMLMVLSSPLVRRLGASGRELRPLSMTTDPLHGAQLLLCASQPVPDENGRRKAQDAPQAASQRPLVNPLLCPVGHRLWMCECAATDE